MTIFMGNISEMRMNATYSEIAIKPINVVLAVLLLVSFLAGITINGLSLWVLEVKMEKTVNVLWFRHLILIFLVFSPMQPFFAMHALFGFNWLFGTVLCKVLNALGSLGMFFEVFLLTIISLDRYIIICHPVWSQRNRTISRAQRLIAGTWFVSLLFSVPYLVFRETREEQNGRIACVNNYAIYRDPERAEVQILAHHVHVALFVMRFLLAFLFPFLIIARCSYRIGQEVKKRRLVKRAGKTVRILVTLVASFFICWLPYHLYNASQLIGGLPDGIRQGLRAVMTAGICFNVCFSSILYLFVGEKSQQVFKTSIVTLAQRRFADVPSIFVDNANVAYGEDPQPHQFAAQAD